MATAQVKLSSKNQITLPASVRAALGVQALDRVNFVIDGEKVTVEPVKLTLADIYQSVPALKHGGVEVADLEYEEAMVMDPDARARIDVGGRDR
jgi:AbrB family looped-hinge helix DNA binding protein